MKLYGVFAVRRFYSTYTMFNHNMPWYSSLIIMNSGRQCLKMAHYPETVLSIYCRFHKTDSQSFCVWMDSVYRSDLFIYIPLVGLVMYLYTVRITDRDEWIYYEKTSQDCFIPKSYGVCVYTVNLREFKSHFDLFIVRIFP